MERVREALEGEGLDALLVTGEANRVYLSGFDGSLGYLLLGREGRGMLLTDFRYLEQAKKQSPHLETVTLKKGPGEIAAEAAREMGWRRLGFEEEHLSHGRYRKLAENFPGELVPVQKLVERARAVKESFELSCIRSAASFLDRAFSELLPGLLQEGVKENEVALELEYYLRKKGAGLPTFRFIVASGERGAMPHGMASEKKLQKGEMVTLDFGVYYRGYASDMTRTVALGEPGEQMREVYRVVCSAQQEALQGIKSGMKGSEADALARRIIDEAGYGDYFGHGLGHGVGLEAHELPQLSPRGEDTLEQGMVATVEPGIYLPSLGGVRIEDMVLVTGEGVELITRSSRELVIL